MNFLNKQGAVFPPMKGSGNREPIAYSGTGTTETVNATALTPGKIYTIAVGAVPVRVAFKSVGGVASSVDAALDITLAAYSHFTFVCGDSDDGDGYGSTFVYMEAADGVAAYTATIWHSGI